MKNLNAPVENSPAASGLMAQELWQRYRKQESCDGGATEKALIQKYLPLASATMDRLAITFPGPVNHDDLHSAGLVGLLQALRNFNPACGVSFETYAAGVIAGWWRRLVSPASWKSSART
jgi:RNA polymerase sigma factor FliA